MRWFYHACIQNRNKNKERIHKLWSLMEKHSKNIFFSGWWGMSFLLWKKPMNSLPLSVQFNPAICLCLIYLPTEIVVAGNTIGLIWNVCVVFRTGNPFTNIVLYTPSQTACIKTQVRVYMCGHVASQCMHMNNSSTLASTQVATG
jgi:hypothetical protein